MYSLPEAKRLAHIRQNPRVALNFNGNGTGGDIIVITGEASESPNDLPADRLPAYTEKYRDDIPRIQMTPALFAAAYSVPLRVRPIALRGH